MTRAAALRWLLVAVPVAALLVLVQGIGGAGGSGQVAVLLPFAAVALAAAALCPVLPVLDRLVTRVAPHRPVSPDAALADAARRSRTAARGADPHPRAGVRRHPRRKSSRPAALSPGRLP